MRPLIARFFGFVHFCGADRLSEQRAEREAKPVNSSRTTPKYHRNISQYIIEILRRDKFILRQETHSPTRNNIQINVRSKSGIVKKLTFLENIIYKLSLLEEIEKLIRALKILV